MTSTHISNRPTPIKLTGLPSWEPESDTELEPVMETPMVVDVDRDKLIESYVSQARNIIRIRGTIDDNPTQITHTLYLSGVTPTCDLRILKQYNITAIINCAETDTITNADTYTSSNIIYYGFSADDNGGYDMSKHLTQSLDFYTKCIAQGRTVLIHCVAGINRSAFVAVYIYMVTMQKKFIEAIQHCFSARPIILRNESFIYQLANVACSINCLQ